MPLTLAPPPAAFLQGDYDPAGYIPGVPATYPQPKPPAVYYQPVMWWLSIGTGTMGGLPVNPGDYIFVVATGRNFGQYRFGDFIFGGVGPRDWPASHVDFVPYDHTLPAEKQPPWPNAGCPFGDNFPGWRIVIDALFNDLVGSRTYGALTYGDEVYGDVDGAHLRWADITRPAYQIVIAVGTSDGAPAVSHAEIGLALIDDDGVWFDFAVPTIWYQADLGTPLRIGFIDPQYRYHPIVIGEIVSIRDEHDTLPRYIEVGGVSRSTELVTAVTGWQRPTEPAATRFMALLAAAGWRWENYSLVFPTYDPMLHADVEPRAIVVRDELDRTVQSAGWYVDEDRWGGIRVRRWPHEPVGTPIVVTDCTDGSDDLLSGSMLLVRDQSQLLNVAVLENAEAVPVAAQAEQPFSIARFGRRSEGMGFPLTGLAFASKADAQTVANRIVNRFGFITRHVDEVIADTDLDTDWLAVLADLDTGEPMTVHRREVHDMTLANVIVGFTHEIVPNRFTSTIHTSTLTPTNRS